MELRKPNKRRSIFTSNILENTLTIKVKRTHSESRIEVPKCYHPVLKHRKSKSIPELVENSFRYHTCSICRKKRPRVLLPGRNEDQLNESNKIEDGENIDTPSQFAKPPIQTKITLSSKSIKVSEPESEQPNDEGLHEESAAGSKEYNYHLFGKDNVNINLAMKFKGVPSSLLATLNPNKEMECQIRYNTDNDADALREINENLDLLNQSMKKHNKLDSKLFTERDVSDKPGIVAQPVTEEQITDEPVTISVDSEISKDKKVVAKPRLSLKKIETSKDKNQIKEPRLSITRLEASTIDQRPDESGLLKSETLSDKQPTDRTRLSILKTEIPLDKPFERQRPSIIKTETLTDKQPIGEERSTLINTEIPIDKPPMDRQRLSIIKTDILKDKEYIDEERSTIMITEIPIDENKLSIIKAEAPTDKGFISEEMSTIINTELPLDVQKLSIIKAEELTDKEFVSEEISTIINTEMPLDEQKPSIIVTEVLTDKESIDEEISTIINTEIPLDEQKPSIIVTEVLTDKESIDEEISTIINTEIPLDEQKPSIIKTEIFTDKKSIDDERLSTIETDVPPTQQHIDGERLSIINSEIPADKPSIDDKRSSIIKTEISANKQPSDEEGSYTISSEISTGKHHIDEQNLPSIRQLSHEPKPPFSKFQTHKDIQEDQMPVLTNETLRDFNPDVERKQFKGEQPIKRLGLKDVKYKTIEIGKITKMTPVNELYALESTITSIKIKEYFSEGSLSNLSSESNYGVADSSELSSEMAPIKEKINYTLFATITPIDMSIGMHAAPRFVIEEPSFIYESPSVLKINPSAFKNKPIEMVSPKLNSTIILPVSLITPSELTQLVSNSLTRTDSRLSSQNFYEVISGSSKTKPSFESRSKTPLNHADTIPVISSSLNQYTISNENSECEPISKFEHLKDQKDDESESTDDRNSRKTGFSEHRSIRNLFEIESPRRKIEHNKDYIIESNMTSFNIKQYRDSSSSSDNSSEFLNTIDNLDLGFSKTNQIHLLNANVYQNINPNKGQLDRRNKNNKKSVETTPTIVSVDGSLQSNNDVRNVLSVKDQKGKDSDKKHIKSKESKISDNSRLTANRQPIVKSKSPEQNKDVSISEQVYSIVPKEKKNKDNEKSSDLPTRTASTAKSANNLKTNDNDKERTLSGSSFEAVDKQYLMHEKIADDKTVGYFIKQTEVSVVMEDPFALSTAITYRETEINKNLQLYLSEDSNKKKLIPSKTIDTQYLKHANILKDTYKTINKEMYIDKSLSKSVKPVEIQCKYKITEEDIKRIIERMGKMPDHPKSAYKDISNIFKELKLTDELLKKLLLNIEEIHGKTMSQVDLKDLERYLEQSSPSYREWKKLNNPSDFTKDRFLLNLVSVIHKTQNYPCNITLDKQYSSHMKLNEDGYTANETDLLKDIRLYNVSQSSRDMNIEDCPLNDYGFDEENMKRVKTNQTLHTDPSGPYQSKLYNLESVKIRSADDSRKGLGIHDTSTETSEMKVKAMLEEARTNKLSEVNYATFFLELLKTLNSTEINITEKLLDEIYANLQLLSEKGLASLSTMELERIAKYINFINIQWKDSEISPSLSGKQFCESLRSHIRDSKSAIKSSMTKSSSAKVKSDSTNKVDELSRTDEKQHTSRTNNDITDQMRTVNEENLKITNVPRIEHIFDANSTANMEASESLAVENLIWNSKKDKYLNYRQFFTELAKLLESIDVPVTIENLKHVLMNLESLKHSKNLSKFTNEDLEGVAHFLNVLKPNWKDMLHANFLTNENFLEGFSSHIKLMITDFISKSHTALQDELCNKRYMKTPHEIPKNRLNATPLNTSFSQESEKPERISDKILIESDKDKKKDPTVSIELRELYTAAEEVKIKVNDPPVLDNQTFSLDVENIIARARQSNNLNYASFFADLIKILRPLGLNITEDLLYQVKSDVENLKKKGLEALYNKELERLAEFVDISKSYLKDFHNPQLYSNENFINDLFNHINTKLTSKNLSTSSLVDNRRSAKDIHVAVTTDDNSRDKNLKINQDGKDSNAIARTSKNDFSKNQNKTSESHDQTTNQVNYEEFFATLSKQLSPLKLDLTNELLDQLLLDLELLSKKDISSLPEKELEKIAGYLEVSAVNSKITNSLSNAEFIQKLTSDINERKYQLSTNTTRSNLLKSEKDKTNSSQLKDIIYAVYFTELSKKLPRSRADLTKETLNQLKIDLGLVKKDGISFLTKQELERIADFVDKSKDQLKGLSNPSQYSNKKFIDDLISETSHLLCSSNASVPSSSRNSIVNHSKDSKAKHVSIEHDQRKSQTTKLSEVPNLKDHTIDRKVKESSSEKNKSPRTSKNGEVEVDNYQSKDLTSVPSIRSENIRSEVIPEILFPVKTDTPTIAESKLIDNQAIIQQNPRISISTPSESESKTVNRFDDHTTNMSIVDETVLRTDGETMLIVNSALSQNRLSTSSIIKIKPLISPEKPIVLMTDNYTNDINKEIQLVQLPETLTSLKDNSELITELEITDKSPKRIQNSVKSLDDKNVFLPTTNSIEIITEYSNIPNNKIEDLNENLIIINSEIRSSHIDHSSAKSTNQVLLIPMDRSLENLETPSSVIEKSNKENIQETFIEDQIRDSVRITVTATPTNIKSDPRTKGSSSNEENYSKEVDKLEEVVILAEIEAETIPNTLQTISIQFTDVQTIEEDNIMNQDPLSYKDSNIEKRNEFETLANEPENVIKDDTSPPKLEKKVTSNDIKESKSDIQNVEKNETDKDINETKSKTNEEFDENNLDIIFNSIFEFLINSSIDNMFSKKPAGDDFSKCNPSMSWSCDNDMSEKTDCATQSPIIDYKTNICFNSKVPIQIAHHEEHSHVQIRKCPNNKNKYRLSNTTFRKTEMILPKHKRKIGSGIRPACDRIVEKEPSDLYKETIENVIDQLDKHVDKHEDKPIDASPKISSATSPAASIIDGSDYEYKIPVIIPKEEKPESIVKFNSTGIWPKLSKRHCDGIQPPSGYYKNGSDYLPYASLYLKQSKSNSCVARKDEFRIPVDGIFGRDLEEPKYTNFCCNSCRSWINLGDRQQHLNECMEKKRFSETMRPKLDPRAIKRMPGIVCYVCGNRYTKHSINIHEKSCLSKWIQQNNSLKRQLRKKPPMKPALNPSEIQSLIQDQLAQGKLDYCAEDAINDLYFLYSRNHLIELNE